MKFLFLIFAVILLNSNLMAKDCLNQKDEMKQFWARADGRTQSGGWLFFMGKATSSTPEQAYFRAEGQALSRLVQECRLIHRKTRIIERCDEKVGTSYIAYVRANVTVKECQKSQQQNDEKDQNEKFTKIYEEYDKQQRKERMINFKGGNSKLSSLRNTLMNLLRKKRTSNVQKEIESKKKELNLLETKNRRKSSRCRDAIDCLIKGNAHLKAGKRNEATWTYYDGCYTYKDPELCFSYAIFIKNGPNSSTKKYSVYNGLKEACSRNHGEACYELGIWERSQYKDKKIDSKLSFKISCDQGFYKGCVERGVLSWDKYYKTANEKHLNSAEKYFTKACRGLDKPEGCYAAYSRIRFSRMTKKKIDKERMKNFRVSLIRYSCDEKKHLTSCGSMFQALGSVSWKKNKGDKFYKQVYNKSFKEGIKYTKEACENGHGASCGTYAYYLREYYKKQKESDALYDKTCKEHKNYSHCVNYSNYLLKNNKVKESIVYAELACSFGYSYGCLTWGTIVEENQNKIDEAATIYKIGCEKGNTASCGRYGLYISDNLNDPEKGLRFIKKGCWYKNTDSIRDKVLYNSNEACVYRAKIEVQKFKRIKQFRNVLKYHCNEKSIRKKAKDMACELYEEISG